jgi:hypothetical protein
MYWYGWIVSAMLAALGVAMVAMSLPLRWRRLISLHIAWLVPLLMVPVMAYTLRVYWR